MENEVHMGCPECSMSYGMSSVLAKKDKEFMCSANPAHKFRMDSDGFLKSL